MKQFKSIGRALRRGHLVIVPSLHKGLNGEPLGEIHRKIRHKRTMLHKQTIGMFMNVAQDKV